MVALTVTHQPVNAQLTHDTGEQPGNVRWQPCVNSDFRAWFDDEPPQGLLCGHVEAPLVYSTNAQSSDVRLALTRLPATGVKKGSVVFVSGGPGMPGINPYLSNDRTVDRLKESYDIIGYDPRGAGQSVPKISCAFPDLDAPPSFADGGIAEPEASLRQVIAACISQSGAQVLKHIGTHEAVNDLNMIRAALGEPSLTAVAYSYGTLVAGLYAERFPEKTRAMVLDGVVDLSEDNYTQQLNQARSYQQTFQRFVTYCARTPHCPLPGDESRAVDAFHRILHHLNEDPLITQEGDEINGDDLFTATHGLLLWPHRWPDLIALLQNANARTGDEQVAALIDENTSLNGDALSVITCADTATPDADIKVLHKQRQEIGAAWPFTNYMAAEEWPLEMCDLWPFQGTFHAHTPVVSPMLPPLLFVGQRYDATTPYVNAQQMAKVFRSPLITREGDGHTLVLHGIDRCVDEAVVDYLLMPEEGAGDKTCR
ncbi:alpha/beta fold hydrolase [Pseudomonas alkylphenolica]|nr:alpha/beta fold hydrolase [Pseudomonas alkylphenolica]